MMYNTSLSSQCDTEYSTSTTKHSAHTTNNIEIITLSPCIAANYTFCDYRQFLIHF